MGTEETAQCLIAHTAFAKDLGSVCSTSVHLISGSPVTSASKDPIPLP